MKRRDFIRNAAFVGATASLIRPLGSRILTPRVFKEKQQSLDLQHDDKDSSRDRNPLDILSSTLVVSGLDPSILNEKYVEMLKAGKVNCWHRTMSGLQSFADAYNFLDDHSNDIVAATTVREIKQAHQKGKISLVFGWQSAGKVLQGQEHGASGPPRTELRAYYQLGLRIVGITYNVTNYFGGGNLDLDIGLTRVGRRLVEEIHKLGIILDIGGHTGEKTSFEAIEMSPGMPVICSHTNVKAINDNHRCISDRLMEAIAKTGGVIGLTAINDFHVRNKSNSNIPITPPTTLDKHLDQYDYARKLIGADYIGIAPDFVEGSLPITDETMNTEVWPLEWNSRGPILYIKGFENITELPHVVRGLIERGWSTGEIRKVLGENWLRVYQQVWGA